MFVQLLFVYVFCNINSVCRSSVEFDDWFVCQVGRLIRWLVDRSARSLVSWLVAWLAGWLAG